MHTESEAQAKNKQSRKKTCLVKMLLRCLFNVKTAQYVKCDGIHEGTLQGPAVMDKAEETNYLFPANSFSSTYLYIHTQCEY